MASEKSLLLALLVLNVLLVAHALPAEPVPCLPSTCPPVPVVAQFEHLDCSGSVSYSPFIIGCSQGTDVAFDEYSVNVTQRDCSFVVDPSYDRTVYLYGICNPERGSMILYNVNDTAEPQTYAPTNSNLPPVMRVDASCNSVENCTALQPAWFNEFYPPNTCPNGRPAAYQAYTNITLNTCYRTDNYRSQMFSCSPKPLTYQWTYYLGSACDTPVEIKEYHYSCTSSVKNTYCVGRLPPTPPVASPIAEPISEPIFEPFAEPSTVPNSSQPPNSNFTSPTVPSSAAQFSPCIFVAAILSLLALTF